MIFKPRTNVHVNIFVTFFLKIEMFDLHKVSIFATGTGESDTAPFFASCEHNLQRNYQYNDYNDENY